MIELFITSQGLIRFLYDESLLVEKLGHPQIHRASQVEPDRDGQWWADLTPSKGPVLGPFALRSQALQAECAWLNHHRLPSFLEQVSESTPHVTAH